MKRTLIRQLGRELHEQGAGMNPDLSPLLHERIMQALRASSLPQPDERASPWQAAWKIGAGLGVAAAVAVACWIVLTPSTPPADQHGGSNPGYADVMPSVPDFVGPLRQQVGTPAAAAMDEGKFAYLDRDAERLITFVSDQLPSFAAAK